MKKLKLTINGEVKTFDLSENGEYKVEVVEHYFPKVGDCVKIYLKNTKNEYYGKINQIEQKEIWIKSVGKDGILYRNLSLYYDYSYIFLTQITQEELKAKYAEAGYDWDYETNEAKPLKWMPKEGDEAWFMNIYVEPDNFIFSEGGKGDKKLLEKDLLFPTKEECQKFADYCWSYFENKNK